MATPGHAFRCSQTNAYGWVPLCECGWIGVVVPVARGVKGESALYGRRVELTQAIAHTQHGAHLEDVRLDHVAYSDKVLATLSTNRVAANATLQRRGRWGHS